MEKMLKEKLEQIIGPFHSITLLDEQGWTSEVRRIATREKSYLLKSSYIARYRLWLKSEAEVLEKLKQNQEIPIPEYFSFFEEEGRSHLLMSFENGMSLTKALKLAKSECEKIALIKSFGVFLQQFHEKEPLQLLKHEGDWLENQLMLAQDSFEKGHADENASLELLNNLKRHKPKTVQQTMIHGDCTTDNVLVINGEVRLFIDVAGMTVGDPRYDEALAIRKISGNPEYLAAFYHGYKRYKVTKNEIQYFDAGLYEFF
ncbi:phosphotransferase [Lysinibacillus sp. SGAir0095]|uniref:phosphotransferase n=1 Tax=Lysinibacillus sp. SGAir0095 TaxID=2070463 RepID=UPI0010CD4811|nr:phosphotransferase [Lysinibacillus sp. SGAir0095]QCR32570.1 amino acid transporter [Lysinibacillus sp. SGAir0095]